MESVRIGCVAADNDIPCFMVDDSNNRNDAKESNDCSYSPSKQTLSQKKTTFIGHPVVSSSSLLPTIKPRIEETTLETNPSFGGSSTNARLLESGPPIAGPEQLERDDQSQKQKHQQQLKPQLTLLCPIPSSSKSLLSVSSCPSMLELENDEIHRVTLLKASDLLPQNRKGQAHTRAFLLSLADILIDYICEESDPNTKVLNFHHPTEMERLIDLSIPEHPMVLGQLLQSCRDVLKLGVRTGHPHFFNQLSCGLDLISMAGEWLTATCNTNMFTYEIAPVFSLMEKQVIKRMVQLIGWTEGDAIFSPGGAIANLYAMNAARHAVFPRCKHLGMTTLPTLCAFTSEDSHYSIKSAAAVLGIGTDNCFNIPTDETGRMIPEELEQKIFASISEGLHPFFVCATAGTTVYGAWDPLLKISEICKRHNLWMHVDAAWGGGLLLSPEHRHKLTGIDHANSVTWNPHKLMGALLQCSACFLRRDGLLFETNQMSADYLFQQDKPYDVSYDTGDKAMQCGRHNDIFKLWLMWRSKGMEGYRKQINRLMQLAEYFTHRIKATEGYEMVIDQPEYLNICFWYVPAGVRDLPHKEKMARLEKIAPKIKAKMMQRGTTMVGYQPDKGRPNFFRMIVSNQGIRESDLDFLIDEIATIGRDL